LTQSHPANIDFNAQHSPMGAFMSFTCGHFGSPGGIGIEIGKPASQNVFIGLKTGDRKSLAPLKCLPFFKHVPEIAPVSTAFTGEQQIATKPQARRIESYSSEQIRRSYNWATDTWETPDFKFTIFSPFGPMPQPDTDSKGARESLLPAVIATLEIDNTKGKETKTAIFAIDFVEQGARIIGEGKHIGFAWKRKMGVLGKIESDNDSPAAIIPVQRWSVPDALADVNPVHALGTFGGLAVEVPAGSKQTLVLSIGVYLDGIVTTGLPGKYFYTQFYSSLDDVLTTALSRSPELRAESAKLDADLKNSTVSPDQQFLIAHSTRSYYGSTQLLDIEGRPFWVVNEGEYCMMNTLDLSVDHVFWELKQNPWVISNLLDSFSQRYSYTDQVKSTDGKIRDGGISFSHDMGVNNNFSPKGISSYELPHLPGCFSFMTQEQLCNWILMAGCYVAFTRDTKWLKDNASLISSIADSFRARADSRGLMTFDSALCEEGQEITTYDSLDESLGQARANTYIAAKCWASWLALEMLARVGKFDIGKNLADEIAKLLTTCPVDDTIPAVLEKENPGYHSRILPVIESLVYPAYWLDCLKTWENPSDLRQLFQNALKGPFIDVLKKHTIKLLTDPKSGNLFPDGGIKLSSTSNNSWMSKIAIFQYVAREVLHLEKSDPSIAKIFQKADDAHVKWQTDGSSYWACCDQIISGKAIGSRYYPRIITTALWLDEKRQS
jgi:hypothetical protein